MSGVEEQWTTEMLGDLIAKEVISTFNRLPSKGKPVVRSNGAKEWTVLASIVAIHNGEITPVCLATGVKTLPEKFRSFSNGLMVHDLHAEILCFRLLNWLLIDECIRVQNGENGTILVESIVDGGAEKESPQFKIKAGMKFALFVTEPPCGDSSMSDVKNGLQDQTPWQESTSPNDDNGPALKKQKLTRGRNYIDKVGIVRTKPGRADSAVSLSKSCSDKICMRQVLGMHNAFTSSIFSDDVYLDYLVTPDSSYVEADMVRCFELRMKNSTAHSLEILRYSRAIAETYGFQKSDSVTSPLSLLYVPSTNTLEVLNNGVKDGGYSKNKPPKKGRESMVCSQAMYTKIEPLIDSLAGRYVDFKRQQRQRQQRKQLARDVLVGWVPTGDDDFEFK